MCALGKVLYEIPNRGRWEILRSYIPDMIPSETMVYEGVFLATDVGFEVIIAIAYLPFAWDGYFPTNHLGSALFRFGHAFCAFIIYLYAYDIQDL